MPTNPFLIYEPQAVPNWDECDERVTTINLGQLDADKPLKMTLPDDLATRFPEVTHLRLWSLDVKELPALPPKLKVLEVRKCPNLTALPPLPEGLEVLVLEELPGLTTLSLPAALPQLWDLSLNGCAELEQATMQALLQRAPALRWLDLSGCEKLREVKAWATTLEKVVLNDCPALGALPARWPKPLRRIELANAIALSQLPAFASPWPDYVNLAGTRSLKHLDRPAGLRTLFLHGSGVMVPPASEHGASPYDNVAERTLRYYADMDLCGRGEVKRCKLLLLGNGSAGKTSLSLALTGQDAAHAATLGSTHGVQFWERRITARVNGSYDNDVHLHLWDFGGQEIYHQTHKIFMSRGAVFVVLWNPDQDGCQPEPNAEGYQDEWRPLQYWLDFIHLACPWKPRIALVCSAHTQRTEALEQQWRNRVTANYHDLTCHYIDSWARDGDLPRLEEWLETEVGGVVSSQGTAVPAYWEVAQDLVERWLPKLDAPTPGVSPAGARDEMSRADFTAELRAEIERATQDERAERFPLLSAAVRDGRFELTDERVQRTLEFLTNSGFLYWHPGLFEQRVIVGQQWALNGIYTVLDRREKQPIYRKLAATYGQFTLRDLKRWVWDRSGYNDEQEETLLSFMRNVGVCFRLVSREESYWEQAVYKTFMHLPFASQMQLEKRFALRRGHQKETIECGKLHREHWHQWLKQMGEHYGTDGEYAQDGFAVRNQKGQEVCVIAAFDPSGLGGSITVRVSGSDTAELLSSVVASVRQVLPEAGKSAHEPPAEHSTAPAGEKANRCRVFVSYTWNPRRPKRDYDDLMTEAVTDDYEAPVDAIEEALKADHESVVLLRDKRVLNPGDSIMTYIAQIKTTEKVLIVHSDKYWRSPYCMFEFCEVMESFTERSQSRHDTLLFIELPSSHITSSKALNGYIQHWEQLDDIPTRMLTETNNVEDLRARVLLLLKRTIPKIHDASLSQRWEPARAAEIVSWVREHLGLQGHPTKKSNE